jgi:hypothetical protein
MTLQTPTMQRQAQGGTQLPAAQLGVPDHRGTPLPPDAPPAVAPPPPEVGPLLSADTVTPRATSTVGGIALLVIVGAVLIGVFVAATGDKHAAHPPLSTEATLVLLVLAVVACIGIAQMFMRSRPGVSYVGRDGVATYTANGKGEIRKARVLPFANAAELFTGSTRNYTNGVYTGTTYFYRWHAPGGGQLLKLSGSYRSKEGTPKLHNPYYFGRAAELAWSVHLLARCQAELDAQRYIEFRVNGSDYVRVGHGVMEFHFGSRTERIAADEVAKINLSQGTFHVAAKDAKWFSRAGKFSFNYARMANARVFLLAVDKLMGLRLS